MGSAPGQELRGGCSREGGEGASLGQGSCLCFLSPGLPGAQRPGLKTMGVAGSHFTNGETETQRREGEYQKLIGVSQVQLPCKICVGDLLMLSASILPGLPLPPHRQCLWLGEGHILQWGDR